MGWVPGFEHDVFISYARVDNATAEGDPQQGWVAQFHRHLNIALSKKIGLLDRLKIWRDTREIQGNQLFDKTIQDAVHGAAVFVALDSHGYQASEYCRRELEWFYQKAQKDSAGLAAGDDYRIFHLLLNNVPWATWPKEFGRTSGFPFHDAPDPDRDGEPCEPSSEMFRTGMRALAEAIHATLARLKNRPSTLDAARGKEPTRFSIYVADTSDTLSAIRKRVLNELKPSTDLKVVTGVPPPFEGAQHDQRMLNELEVADLSVHLLDAYPGREIVDQEGSSYPQRQVELALAHGKSQLIWTPQSLSRESIEDEAYAAFLEKLENGPRERSTYDFQRDVPSGITRQILAKVEELRARSHIVSDMPGEAALLDTHWKDQLYALKLGEYLVEHNVRPYIDPQEDDPSTNLDFFTRRLKQVGILILFYGTVAEEWVRARLAVTLQIAIAEQCPLRACGVYVAPPRKPGDAGRLSLPLVPVEWMDHTGGFNASAVDHLLARARTRTAGEPA